MHLAKPLSSGRFATGPISMAGCKPAHGYSNCTIRRHEAAQERPVVQLHCQIDGHDADAHRHAHNAGRSSVARAPPLPPVHRRRPARVGRHAQHAEFHPRSGNHGRHTLGHVDFQLIDALADLRRIGIKERNDMKAAFEEPLIMQQRRARLPTPTRATRDSRSMPSALESRPPTPARHSRYPDGQGCRIRQILDPAHW